MGQQGLHRRFGDALQRRHVRPQVEVLKDHGRARTQALQLRGVAGVQHLVLAIALDDVLGFQQPRRAG